MYTESGGTSDISDTGEGGSQNQPIFDGSDISVTMSNILIMSYAKRFNLTQEAFQAVIDLVRVHCPKENNCVSSVYKLKSFFKDILTDDGYQPKCVKYCRVCLNLVDGEHISVCDVQGCAGQSEPLITFQYIPIQNQLRKLFQG